MLSASADGLVSLISTALPLEDEDDALLQVRNHRSPVQRAGFLAATPATAARDMEAWALSTDECLTIYNLAETDTSPDPSGVLTDFGDVRPSLGCAYVVGLFPKGDGAVILSGVTE